MIPNVSNYARGVGTRLCVCAHVCALSRACNRPDGHAHPYAGLCVIHERSNRDGQRGRDLCSLCLGHCTWWWLTSERQGGDRFSADITVSLLSSSDFQREGEGCKMSCGIYKKKKSRKTLNHTFICGKSRVTLSHPRRTYCNAHIHRKDLPHIWTDAIYIF